MRKRFTKKELDYISRNYSVLPAKDIAKHLGRTLSSVYQIAHKNNLDSGCLYSESEKSFMTIYYGILPSIEIVEILGKPRNSVGKFVLRNKLTLVKQGKWTPLYCKVCGKQLSRRSSYSNTRTDYCWDCYKAQYRGAQTSNWQGGISEFAHIVRVRLGAWRKQIRERDGYECRHCGATEKLHVHHLSDTFVSVRDKVLAGNPSLNVHDNTKYELADLIAEEHANNVQGITLCSDCHTKLHCEKRDELLGTLNTLGEDNQQGSSLNAEEQVSENLQRLTLEDMRTNKSDTSVPNDINKFMYS